MFTEESFHDENVGIGEKKLIDTKDQIANAAP
jgi:hypothetical protein